MDEIAGSGSRLTFGGLATGLDTGAIIEAILDAERRPLNLLEGRKATLQSQQTALQTLSSSVLKLRDAARDIDNRTSLFSGSSFDEEFLKYMASSGDERLEVEVTGNASPGNFEVTIDELATVGLDISAAFADPNAALSNKKRSFDIDYGGESPIELSVPKNTTLAELRDLINLDANNDGSVRATLLDDGSGTRLVIAGSNTGADHDISISTDLKGPGNSDFIEKEQDAQDAQIEYLGVTVTRSSNEIADVVPGVSLRLRGKTDGLPVEVTVARDDEAIEASVQTLVDAYNSIQTFMNDQATINPDTNRGGVLIGDSMLRSVASRIRTHVTTRYDVADIGAAETDFMGAFDIGIEIQRDGTLSFDAEKLRAALDDDATRVRTLLSGVGEGVSEGEGGDRREGLASALAMALDGITKPGESFFDARNEGVERRIDTIDDQIDRLERRLIDREEFLVRQFSQLESLISTIRAQSGFLGGQ
jgi:flagellar hook-associated protein 2